MPNKRAHWTKQKPLESLFLTLVSKVHTMYYWSERKTEMDLNIQVLFCGRDRGSLILTDLLSLKIAFAFSRDRSSNITLLSG